MTRLAKKMGKSEAKPVSSQDEAYSTGMARWPYTHIRVVRTGCKRLPLLSV